MLILKVHSKSWKNVLNGILFSWILQKLSKLWISISCLCSPPPSVIISIPAPKVRSTALFCQWKYLIFFFACPQEPFPTPFSLIYFPSLIFQFLIMKKNSTLGKSLFNSLSLLNVNSFFCYLKKFFLISLRTLLKVS